MSSRAVITLLMLLALGAMAYADQTPITFDTNSSTFLVSGSTQYNWQDLTFTPLGPITITAAALTAGSGSVNINSLGSFSLPYCGFCGNSYDTGSSDGFDLKIHFTAPIGLNGGQTADWDTDLTGSFGCIGVCGGTVGLFFDTWTQTFTYGPPGNPNGSGQFTLSLTGGQIESYQGTNHYEYDLSGTFGDSQKLTAQITNASFSPHDASVPEPTSIILLGTVLCGVAVSLRKRLA